MCLVVEMSKSGAALLEQWHGELRGSEATGNHHSGDDLGDLLPNAYGHSGSVPPYASIRSLYQVALLIALPDMDTAVKS